MSKVSKAKAEKVLAELQEIADKYGISNGPNLRDHHHEELRPGSWSIDWEEGPEGWCYDFTTKVPGVFVEAINHCIIGVHAA